MDDLVPSDYRFACLQRHHKFPPLWCDLVEISQDNHFEEEDATIFEVDFHIEVPQMVQLKPRSFKTPRIPYGVVG